MSQQEKMLAKMVEISRASHKMQTKSRLRVMPMQEFKLSAFDIIKTQLHT